VLTFWRVRGSVWTGGSRPGADGCELTEAVYSITCYAGFVLGQPSRGVHMKNLSCGVTALVCLASLGCGSGDNSGAVRAQAGIKPGMAIWDALDHAEQSHP
jgi:hypothetical protein